jgi:ATP-binding protein involved in chromosome partitioning
MPARARYMDPAAGFAKAGTSNGVLGMADDTAGFEQKLMRVLRAVAAPGGSTDLVTAGLVDSLQAKDGLVHVALRAQRSQLKEMEAAAAEVARALKRQPGVLNATVVLTSHRPEPAPAPRAPGPHGENPGGEKFLQSVNRVIAVASGKGGVGKSTLAVNLALGLSQLGLRVGLIDADIHGPSLARMLGVGTKPEVVGKMMQPIDVFGLRTMSMAFLVPEDQAMIWRGPMVMGALQQMLGQTDWGPLDVMVVDLPPGTGDAQLTLSQRVVVDGAVIVSTPQDIALIDARRGVSMFEKVGVRVLGVVENMSFFACPKCGHEAHIFGHGGARAEAARLGVPFLGEVPLLLDVREAGDSGRPLPMSAPDSAGARAFAAIARRVWESVET